MMVEKQYKMYTYINLIDKTILLKINAGLNAVQIKLFQLTSYIKIKGKRRQPTQCSYVTNFTKYAQDDKIGISANLKVSL